MSESARVTSVETVARFAAALRQFGDEASGALLALDQQVNRALHWIEHEAPALWRKEVRRQYDEVARARSAFENCKMRVVAGHEPACIEEEKALRAAKRRLAEAQEKLELTGKWAVKLRREIDEYRGRVGRLKRVLDADVPKAVGLLDRTSAALDAYVGSAGEPDAAPPAGGG